LVILVLVILVLVILVLVILVLSAAQSSAVVLNLLAIGSFFESRLEASSN